METRSRTAALEREGQGEAARVEASSVGVDVDSEMDLGPAPRDISTDALAESTTRGGAPSNDHGPDRARQPSNPTNREEIPWSRSSPTPEVRPCFPARPPPEAACATCEEESARDR